MTNKECIAEAVLHALAHAKVHGISPGTKCATAKDERAFTLIRTEGTRAFVSTVDGDQERPLEEVFDVNLVRRLVSEIRAADLASDGPDGGVIVCRLQ